LGNGDSINIWKQLWLRDSNQPFVTTPMIEGREGMKVDELIINNSSTWNHELIQQIFNVRDAHEIAKIPLNLTQQEDAPMWRFCKSGMYSVRSAYYQLMETIVDNNHLKESGNWKKLWQLRVPNKVKIFLWRVLRGCLPVRSRLTQKGVQCDNKCPHCVSYEMNDTVFLGV
jgi:hypothetical protein